MNNVKKILVLALLSSGLCVAVQSSHGTLDQDLLRKFTDVYTKIKSEYVTPVEDAKLIDHAIDGMLNVSDSEDVRTKLRASLRSKRAPEHKQSGTDPELLKELHRFTRAYVEIKRNYASVSDEELIGLAIQGMVSGLDPSSKYLNAESAKEILYGGAKKSAGAVGIEFSKKGNTVVVVEPIAGSPADVAGLRRGEMIEEIDNQSTADMELEEVAVRLRGKTGSKVSLAILDESGSRRTIVLVRKHFTYKSVTGSLNASNIGYLRIRRFENDTAKDASEEIANLDRMSRRNLAGLVLDLRNNPGGLLSTAVALSDLFIDEGLIVSTDGRGEDSRLKFFASPATGREIGERIPIVVLVDKQTAGGAEIAAAALQDHKRAVIMGARTFGRGSIQTLILLGDGDMLKLTTANFFRPSGETIQSLGVTPNVCIEDHAQKMESDRKKKRSGSQVLCPEVIRVNFRRDQDAELKRAIELISDKAAYRQALNKSPRAGQ